MKLDDIAHTGRPWRLHALAHDFDLIDVWALPTPGGPGDLARLASIIAASDESLLSHPVVRTLFSVRMKLGTWLGWDTGLDAALHGWSLRDRLPRDLRDGPRGPEIMTLVPFPSVYLTNTEWVAECSSKLVHMVQHVGWIPDGSGGHRAQLATLVRPKSRLGRLYVRGISPIRRHVVSPVQVRTIARDWEERSQVWEMTR